MYVSAPRHLPRILFHTHTHTTGAVFEARLLDTTKRVPVPIPNDTSSESPWRDVPSADLNGTDNIPTAVEMLTMEKRPRGQGGVIIHRHIYDRAINSDLDYSCTIMGKTMSVVYSYVPGMERGESAKRGGDIRCVDRDVWTFPIFDVRGQYLCKPNTIDETTPINRQAGECRRTIRSCVPV